MQLAKRIGLAGKLSFAHLAGIRKAAAEGDEPEKKDDDDKAKAAQSDEDPQPDAAADDPKGKAEGSDNDADDGEPDGDEKKDAKAEHEEPDGDEKSAKASRAGKSAKATRAAVEAERHRCSQIIAHGVKLGAVKSAGVFAFDTDMTAEQAIAALDAARADGADNRPNADASAARAARNPQLGTGSALERDSQAAARAGWERAIAKYAPRKR